MNDTGSVFIDDRYLLWCRYKFITLVVRRCFMAVPISLASRLATFVFMAIIPFAAFYGAYVFDEHTRVKNLISFTIGLIAVVGLIIVISLNT